MSTPQLPVKAPKRVMQISVLEKAMPHEIDQTSILSSQYHTILRPCKYSSLSLSLNNSWSLYSDDRIPGTGSLVSQIDSGDVKDQWQLPRSLGLRVYSEPNYQDPSIIIIRDPIQCVICYGNRDLLYVIRLSQWVYKAVIP